MTRPILLVLLAVLFTPVQQPGVKLSPELQQQFIDASRRIKHLSPKAFLQLPANIRSQLERKNCLIPQPYLGSKPGNVVQGRFAAARQRDWAVLCSIEGKSSILVFWGGRARCKSELAQGDDSGFLQTLDGRIGYSRMLARASPKIIAAYATRFNAPLPFVLKHDGAEDIFLGKASIVYYCQDGKWRRLQGAD